MDGEPLEQFFAAGLDAAARGGSKGFVADDAGVFNMWRWGLFEELECADESVGRLPPVFDERYVVAYEPHALGKLGLGDPQSLSQC